MEASFNKIMDNFESIDTESIANKCIGVL